VSGFFASGRVVDFVLVVMAVEAALLAWHRRRSGRGVPVAELAAFLAAGACLLLALRAALAGASWVWIAAALAGAGAAHLADLRLRWRR
jgi:cytochrome c oxidase assembly factor CtaG